MKHRLVGRLWEHDRLALAVITLGSLLAAVGWHGTSRPMADTVGYRQTARVLADGWPMLTDRTPGYPLVLLATGSSDRSTQLLFFVQLAMHVLAVVLVVDLGRLYGLSPRWRALMAALLFAPPVMLRVLHEGTEATAALLLTIVGWMILRPTPERQRTLDALAIGLACGAAALVRPTFALLWVPAALLVAWMVPEGERLRRALLVAAPAALLIGGLIASNAVRFDSASLTPLTGYHLSSRTSEYVEELPASYEPARSVLIRHRDEALLRGESSAPTNFIWEARDDLSKATGLQGRDLDRYVLEIDLYLISHNPLAYTSAVFASGLNYTQMDSQPAVLGLGRPVAQLMQVIHLLLGLVVLAGMVTVPGLWLAGRVTPSTVRALAVGGVLIGYTALVSAMAESGTARLRAPSEPLLAFAVVLCGAIAWRGVQAHRGAVETSPGNS